MNTLQSSTKMRFVGFIRCQKLTSSILSLLILALLIPSSTNAQEEEEKKKKVVCSTTQVADFARNVVGDRWEVFCVLSSAEDPHTYEVRLTDSELVAEADLCLQNGWNLEGHGWMEKLAQQSNKPIRSCVEGVEPLEFDEDGKTVNDPHAWLAPANAKIYVDNIVEAVSEIDPDNAEEYQARAQLYIIQLKALDNWINRQLATLPANQRVLVTHHDAFGYFCKRYDFKAASPIGWTTGEMSDLGLGQRKAVVDQIRDLGVKAIFVESTINEEVIQGIAKEAGAKVGGKLYSDAMGETDSAGETYLGMMRENVLTIISALR